MMKALLAMDAVPAIVVGASVVGVCAVVVAVRAVVSGGLRRVYAAALVGAVTFTIAAVGATWLGIDSVRVLAG